MNLLVRIVRDDEGKEHAVKEKDTKMTELNLITGSECHTSHGAYGVVKVLVRGELTHHYKLSSCETNWDDVVEIGNGGKHGKWIPATLSLEPGTIVYVEGGSTHRRRPHKTGRGWFEVGDDEGAGVSVSTPGCSNHSLEVSGPLRRLDYAEMKERNLPIWIRSSKHLSVSEAQQRLDTHT